MVGQVSRKYHNITKCWSDINIWQQMAAIHHRSPVSIQLQLLSPHWTLWTLPISHQPGFTRYQGGIMKTQISNQFHSYFFWYPKHVLSILKDRLTPKETYFETSTEWNKSRQLIEVAWFRSDNIYLPMPTRSCWREGVKGMSLLTLQSPPVKYSGY